MSNTTVFNLPETKRVNKLCLVIQKRRNHRSSSFSNKQNGMRVFSLFLKQSRSLVGSRAVVSGGNRVSLLPRGGSQTVQVARGHVLSPFRRERPESSEKQASVCCDLACLHVRLD